MIPIFLVLFLIVSPLTLVAQHEHHQSAANSASPKSPRTSAMAMVGKNHVHIDYGSPSVRGRTIWNGLVAYNQVWAAGAHKATWIEFSEDVRIHSVVVPKGRYGFFTIPDKDEWTLILSKEWDMHLADGYDASEDVIRMKVKPTTNPVSVESLTYEVIKINNTKGTIRMSWEQRAVSFDFETVQ